MTKLWRDDNDHQSLARCNRNGMPYSVNHERYASSSGEGIKHSFRGYALSAPEPQQNELDSEEKPQHRRRIPVACGRCRKRKIKCSGPQGDDGCHNCKAAGTNEHCQFNRVQSEEIPFLKDRFNYDPTAAQRTLRSRTFTPTYPPPPIMIPVGNQQPYRQIQLGDYQFQPKSACYAPSYAIDYIDDGVDYNIMPPTYQHLNPDHHILPYAANSTTRPWTPMPGLKPPGTTMYYDPDQASCVYSPVPPMLYHSNSTYGIRSSLSTESSNFSFHGMANSLPAPSPLTSNERVLPPLLRSSDEGSYSNSSAQNATPVIKTMPGESPVPSTQQTCIPLSVSTDDASQSYAPTDITSEQDIYGSSINEWTGGAQDSQPSLRSHSSQSDLFSYGPSSDSSSSRKMQRESRSTSGAGMLSNGQIYVPYQNPGSSRMPQMQGEGMEHPHEGAMHREHLSTTRVG